MSRRKANRLASAIVAAAILNIGCSPSPETGLQPSAATTGQPNVVARVNGTEISASDLHRARIDLLALSAMQDADGIQPEPADSELDRAALETLIQRELLLQEAERRNLTVPEDDIDAALSALRDRFSDLENLGAWMQERGLTDESLMRALREDTLTRQLTAELIDELGENPSEQAVEDFYREHEGDLAIGEEVRLQIIAVDSAGEAQEIAAALRDGGDFSRLARERSLGLRASMAGLTDWVAFDSLELPLQRVVAELEEGAAFGPLQKSENEFLIVALTARRPIVAGNLDAARERIRAHLTSISRRRALQEWMAKTYERAEIERHL